MWFNFFYVLLIGRMLVSDEHNCVVVASLMYNHPHYITG